MSNEKNYYEHLGLKKDCTKDDIKDAYRILILKWHPDKNKNNKEVATKKFMEISKAYKVLSDEDSRKKYDKYGISIKENDNIIDPYEIFNKVFENDNDIPDVMVQIKTTIHELYEGFTRSVEYIRYSQCKKCKSTGTYDKSNGDCIDCKGRGIILETLKGGKMGYIMNEKKCASCNGSGMNPEIKKCKKCSGNKYVQETVMYDLDVPSGAYNGYCITLENEGNYIPINERDNKHYNEHDNKHYNEHDNKHYNEHDNKHYNEHDNKHYNEHDNKHDNEYDNKHYNEHDNKHDNKHDSEHDKYSKNERTDVKFVIIEEQDEKIRRGVFIQELKRINQCDVMIDIEINFSESINGIKKKVKYLIDQYIEIAIDEVIQNNDIYVIKNMGMPMLLDKNINEDIDEDFATCNGDLFIRFKIKKPILDKKQKKKIWQIITDTSYQEYDEVNNPTIPIFLDQYISDELLTTVENKQTNSADLDESI